MVNLSELKGNSRYVQNDSASKESSKEKPLDELQLNKQTTQMTAAFNNIAADAINHITSVANAVPQYL